MYLRKDRALKFFYYLKNLEQELAREIELTDYLLIEDIEKNVIDEIDIAIKKIESRVKSKP